MERLSIDVERHYLDKVSQASQQPKVSPAGSFIPLSASSASRAKRAINIKFVKNEDLSREIFIQ